MEQIYVIYESIGVLVLIFARIVGMFVTAPILSQNSIPTYTKVGFSLLLTIIIFPVMDIPAQLSIDNFYYLLILTAKELLIGMLIGFICYLFFSIVYLAGHIIDMEIGFSMASVINPQDDTEIPLTANLFFIIAVLVFLSINGHHKLIYAVKNSFDILPLGKLSINIFMIDKLISILISTFVLSFKMAAPILVSAFLANLLLGILARTMPQMNVFVVGMPLKVSLGIMLIFIILPLYIGFYEFIFDSMFENLNDYLYSILKG